MCGINGILSGNNDIKRKISLMNNLLRHRGPDDEGFTGINTGSGKFQQYSGNDSILPVKNNSPHISNAGYENFDLFLGHRRLSIIDLSQLKR
jgi:asparagine synthase (glutamine-hydrolysing)